MSKYVVDSGDLVDVADAIRTKGGTSANLEFPSGFVDAIGDISGGGSGKLASLVDRSITTVTAKDLEGLTQIGDHAFSNCRSLRSIVIPGGVTKIDDSAFYYCFSLTSIEIPDSLTLIGDNAFYSCTSLTSITIPNNVTSIGFSAFCSCKSLISVRILDSVTSISDFAFAYCNNLMSITCYASTPPTIFSNTFADVPNNCIIYVPSNSVSAYKSASYWSDRAAYIQAIPA